MNKRNALGLLVVWVLFAGGDANATDYPITGKLLLLKSTPKLVLLSKDPSIHFSGSPACPAADSSLTLTDGAHTHTFALPCAGWSDNGTVAKYKNSLAPGGPSEVKVSKDQAGLLKVVAKGLGVSPYPTERRRSASCSISVGRSTATTCLLAAPVMAASSS